jgi:hypothetical protein
VNLIIIELVLEFAVERPAFCSKWSRGNGILEILINFSGCAYQLVSYALKVLFFWKFKMNGAFAKHFLSFLMQQGAHFLT